MRVGVPIASASILRWMSLVRCDMLAVDRDHDVARAQSRGRRGASLDHLDDLDAVARAELAGDARRQRARAARDAEVRAPHASVAHERARRSRA